MCLTFPLGLRPSMHPNTLASHPPFTTLSYIHPLTTWAGYRQPQKEEVGTSQSTLLWRDRDGAGRGLSPVVWGHSLTLACGRKYLAILRQAVLK